MKCGECKETIDDDSIFCACCGSKVHRPSSCPECAHPCLPDHRFCTKCGGPIEATTSTSTSTSTPKPAQPIPAPAPPIPPKVEVEKPAPTPPSRPKPEPVPAPARQATTPEVEAPAPKTQPTPPEVEQPAPKSEAKPEPEGKHVVAPQQSRGQWRVNLGRSILIGLAGWLMYLSPVALNLLLEKMETKSTPKSVTTPVDSPKEQGGKSTKNSGGQADVGDRQPVPSPPKPASSPVDDLRDYYTLLSSDKYRDAYALRSRKSHNKTSLSEFKKSWSNNSNIEIGSLNLSAQKSNRSLVKGRIYFSDQTVDGRTEKKPYRVSVKLVLENGRWRYDGGDFKLEVEPYRVDPGQGVGYIRLGQSVPSSAHSGYGASSFTEPGNSMDSGSRYWQGRILVKLNDGRARNNVFMIYVYSEEFKTARGVGVGSSLQEVLAAYPRMVRGRGRVMDGGTLYKVEGISFIEDRGRIRQLTVYR